MFSRFSLGGFELTSKFQLMVSLCGCGKALLSMLMAVSSRLLLEGLAMWFTIKNEMCIFLKFVGERSDFILSRECPVATFTKLTVFSIEDGSVTISLCVEADIVDLFQSGETSRDRRIVIIYCVQ